MRRNILILSLFFLCVALAVSCSTAKIPIGETFDVISDNVSGGLEDDPLKIFYLRPESPNSVGGVDVKAMFKNQSDKAIKYIRVAVTPYNAVMDPVKCKITGDSTVLLTSVGPWVSGGVDFCTWDNVWYNSTIRYIALRVVRIEYMDGTSVSMAGDVESLASELDTE